MTKPPFTVSSKAISMIAEIPALVEQFAIRFERAVPIGSVSGRVNEVFGCIKSHESYNTGELSVSPSIPRRTPAAT